MKFGLFMCLILLSSASHAMTCTSEENPNKKLVIEPFGYKATAKIYTEGQRNYYGSVMAGKFTGSAWSADGSKKVSGYTFYNQDGELVTFHYKVTGDGSGGCRARVCDAPPFGTVTGKLSVDGGDYEYFDCY
ncbi:MAG: hypothetical protein CME64_14675 [Halobacteriovoraceae bacterium]|nr:hypothetical protein [Halobacteriovoraceae bacterium]